MNNNMKTEFNLYNLVKNDKAIMLIICLMGILAISPMINSIYFFHFVQSDAFAATGTTLMAIFTFIFAVYEAKERYYRRLADGPILEISIQKVKDNKITFKVKNVGNSAAMELKLITITHIPHIQVKYNKENKIIGIKEDILFPNKKISNEVIAGITINNLDLYSWLGYEPLKILKPNKETKITDYAYIHIERNQSKDSKTSDLSKLPIILRGVRKRYASIDLVLRYVYLDELKYEQVVHLIFDREKHKNLEDAWKSKI